MSRSQLSVLLQRQSVISTINHMHQSHDIISWFGLAALHVHMFQQSGIETVKFAAFFGLKALTPQHAQSICITKLREVSGAEA